MRISSARTPRLILEKENFRSPVLPAHLDRSVSPASVVEELRALLAATAFVVAADLMV